MEALIERVAGLDVHQGSVVACIMIGTAGRRPAKEVRSFGAMRQDLAALRAWLLERGVTHVGMEATGVYWRPVHAALEGAFTLIVGNASHMRNVPGRCRRPRSECCAIWSATARRWWAPWRPSATARSSCSGVPASSSRA